MQNQERFMVRTTKLVDDKYVFENTLAVGRPEAVRQAERAGQFELADRAYIRAFLEGEAMGDWKVIELCSAALGLARIYKID